MKRVSFNRSAERELAEAVDHYDAEVPGLGLRFLEVVRHSLILLEHHPESSIQIRGKFRRFVLPKFPYSLIYRPLQSRPGIRILAVAHHKRNPDYWAGRQ